MQRYLFQHIKENKTELMAEFEKPALLNTGDKVAIVAPAGMVEPSYIERTTEILETWGLKVEKGKHLLSRYHQFAGKDEQRLEDFQQAIDSDEVKAVICARGGYGTIRIVDRINWNKFRQAPKWITGFSDITSIHLSVLEQGIQSVHSIMPINIGELEINSQPVEMLARVLFEGKVEYELPVNDLNTTGTEIAPVTGGNLSLIYALAATPFAANLEGKILFLEDVGEDYYHIDRMMQSLRLSGVLEKLSGLIVGGLTQMKDDKRPFGKTPKEIIAEVVEDYDYPVVFDFPAGHMKNNLPVILGAKTAMEVTNKYARVKFE